MDDWLIIIVLLFIYDLKSNNQLGNDLIIKLCVVDMGTKSYNCWSWNYALSANISG